MKKYILFLFITCLFLPVMAQQKQDKCSEEKFRAKKEAFLTKKAELTPEEAEKFFPLYFELQDRKAKINNETWEKGRKGNEPGTSEAEYADILDAFMEANKEGQELDKEYLKKYQNILSNKKIYKILKAEIFFNRHMLKIMQEVKDK